MFNLDFFKTCQLAQSNFKNVFGLPVAQLEGLDQRRLGLIAFANYLDHFINVQPGNQAPFQHVNTVVHLRQTVLAAAGYAHFAKLDPVQQHGNQTTLAGAACIVDTHKVNRCVCFKAGVAKQQI